MIDNSYQSFDQRGPNSFDLRNHLANINHNVAQMGNPIELMQRGYQDSPGSYAYKQEFQSSAKFGQEAF